MTTPTLAGASYRMLLAQSVTSSCDLDRSAIPAVQSTYQYESYGNGAAHPKGWSWQPFGPAVPNAVRVYPNHVVIASFRRCMLTTKTSPIAFVNLF
jgi:hypothetical protein